MTIQCIVSTSRLRQAYLTPVVNLLKINRKLNKSRAEETVLCQQMHEILKQIESVISFKCLCNLIIGILLYSQT